MSAFDSIPPCSARFLAALGVASATVACGAHDGEQRAPTISSGEMGGAGNAPHSTVDPCAGRPKEGCPCGQPGESVPCGTVYRDDEAYVNCSIGEITCEEDEYWGACVGDSVSALPIPETGAN